MSEMKKVIEIVKKGGVVIFPTDTAYGIGCRMDDEKAVKRLFEIRKRPINQATPVLVSSIPMAEKFFRSPLPDVVRRMMGRYWPGALTIVYKCEIEKVPELVRGGTDTLGIRMPNHPLILEIIEGVGVPVLGPSANFHGDRTPYSYDELDGQLKKLADYTLDGECPGNNVSTVVDCTCSPPKILRQGAIKIEEKYLYD